MPNDYGKEAHQFLAVYRFLSYALSIFFIQIGLTNSPGFQTNEALIYIVFGILGIYSMLKVFSPLRWRERSKSTYIILSGDLLVAVALAASTGGVNSAFLLYSLTPVITAALLFEEKTAIIFASLASVTLSITHLASADSLLTIPSIMQGTNLTLLIIYTLFCFTVALVPFRANLNIKRRIETEAIVEERRRIARELHDGVAQSIGYLNLKTGQISDLVSSQDKDSAMNELNHIKEIVHNTYDDIREAIDQLSAETGSLPLAQALENYLNDFGRKNEIMISFECPQFPPVLSPAAELQMLRIAQEALTNVRRHAQATEVAIKLIADKESVEMIIKDNGRGFDQEDLEARTPGYHGMDIIRERAEIHGGYLHISTAPDSGTAVMVSLPLDKVRL